MVELLQCLHSKGDGVINDQGDVVCIVKFSAVTFKPLVNEVVDAVVSDVEKFGIHANVGPMKVFIAADKIPSDFEYTEFPNHVFQSQSQKISKDSLVRCRIMTFDLKGDLLYAIGTLTEDFLGVLDEQLI